MPAECPSSAAEDPHACLHCGGCLGIRLTLTNHDAYRDVAKAQEVLS